MKRSNLLHLKRSKVTNNVFEMFIKCQSIPMFSLVRVARKRADGRSLQSGRSAKSKQPFSEKESNTEKGSDKPAMDDECVIFGVDCLFYLLFQRAWCAWDGVAEAKSAHRRRRLIRNYCARDGDRRPSYSHGQEMNVSQLYEAITPVV